MIGTLGFHRSCIYDWLAKYEAGDEAALATRPIQGRPRKSSDEHAERSRELIKMNPLQLDLHDALWTQGMIRELLKSEFDVEVNEHTVSNILAHFGITVQCPHFEAYEQDFLTAKARLEEVWPAIQEETRTNWFGTTPKAIVSASR